MNTLKRSAGRGGVGALAFFVVALCLSNFWVDWHDVNEDTHGASIVMLLVVAAAAPLVGAVMGAFAAVLVSLHKQS